MKRFVLNSNLPPAVLPLLGKHLFPLEWMIPAWCEYVSVSWSNQDGERHCSLHITVQHEYRFAELCVTPTFLEIPDELQRDSVIHEMIHISLNPLYDYARNTIGILINDNEVFKVHAQEVLSRLLEGATQDLAKTVFDRLI